MDELLEQLFSKLPTEPNERLAALLEIHRGFHDKLAATVSPIIQEFVQKSPPSEEGPRRAMASRINHALNEMSLALVDPGTEKPATLVADKYRLRLQSRQPQTGKVVRSRKTNDLPPITTIFRPRTEPLFDWRSRTKRDADLGAREP